MSERALLITIFPALIFTAFGMWQVSNLKQLTLVCAEAKAKYYQLEQCKDVKL